MNEKAKKLLKGLGTKYAEKGVAFKGYEVFEPSYDGDVCIGFPLIILQKGEDARLSTNEESVEYLRMRYGDEEE